MSRWATGRSTSSQRRTVLQTLIKSSPAALVISPRMLVLFAKYLGHESPMPGAGRCENLSRIAPLPPPLSRSREGASFRRTNREEMASAGNLALYQDITIPWSVRYWTLLESPEHSPSSLSSWLPGMFAQRRGLHLLRHFQQGRTQLLRGLHFLLGPLLWLHHHHHPAAGELHLGGDVLAPAVAGLPGKHKHVRSARRAVFRGPQEIHLNLELIGIPPYASASIQFTGGSP